MENTNENIDQGAIYDDCAENNALIHRYANKNMIADATYANKIIDIDGKSYLKFRLWVHELLKISADNISDHIHIADSESGQYFYLTQTIELLEQKLQSQLNINKALHQLNRNLMLEQDHIINAKNREIAKLKTDLINLPEKISDELKVANDKLTPIREELTLLINAQTKLRNRNIDLVNKNNALNTENKESKEQIKSLLNRHVTLKSHISKHNKMLEIHRLLVKSKIRKLSKSTDHSINSLKSMAEKNDLDMYRFTDFAISMLDTLHLMRASQEQASGILDTMDFIINQPQPEDIP
ncbi:MAG: hypothetical protein IPJ39_18195 [Saprospiraceae bacterium]|nr:hypothetical protein [Saprospiraceae bacterium]